MSINRDDLLLEFNESVKFDYNLKKKNLKLNLIIESDAKYFLEELFKLLPIYPINTPANGNKTTTNIVREGLININVDRKIIILIGSLKNISNVPITDHSISTN